MTSRDKTAPIKIVFQIDDNKNGVSIKHIADIDNDEVIQSAKIKYSRAGNIEKVRDPYIGDYYLIRVKEIYE
jgi:hypothetical protein